MTMQPFKIDKLGNVTDRETGQQLGYLVKTDYGDVMAAFCHIPLSPGDDFTNVESSAYAAFLEEVGHPPYFEMGFRTRAAAAQFLWDTREHPRAEFPPSMEWAPNVGDAIWVVASTVRGEWYQAKRGVKPYFVREAKGWAVYGSADDLKPGQSATVWKRNGEETTVELAEVIRTETFFDATFVTVLVKKTPRESSGRSSSYRRGGRSNYRRNECPCCGEGRDGMFNGYRCDECGYRR